MFCILKHTFHVIESFNKLLIITNQNFSFVSCNFIFIVTLNLVKKCSSTLVKHTFKALGAKINYNISLKLF